VPARPQDLHEPGLHEERGGAQDDVGPEPVRGGEDRVEGEPGGLLAVQVLPYLAAAAGQNLPGFGERVVEESQRRVERIFLDRLAETGQGL